MSQQKFSQLDTILTIMLVVVFVPLSLWGGAEAWSGGAADVLPFIMILLGVAYIIFESIRLCSPLIGAVLGALMPLVIIGPSLLLYPYDIEALFVAVPLGGLFGLVASGICWFVKRRKPKSQADSKSTSSDEPESISGGDAEEASAGIAGWLILPAIGIALAPLLGIIGIVRSIGSIGSVEFERLALQYPGIRMLTGFELLSKIAITIFASILAYLFFKQKSSAPRIYIAFLITNLVYSLILFIWLLGIYGADDGLQFVAILRSSNILGYAIAAAIWIPYFKLSKRVEATFTE